MVPLVPIADGFGSGGVNRDVAAPAGRYRHIGR
jgi:hypothetical protein